MITRWSGSTSMIFALSSMCRSGLRASGSPRWMRSFGFATRS
jgi:hypothetical protein